MMVTIRVSQFDSVIAHLTGSCRRDDGPAPLLESTTVMSWPPITARTLSSQSLAFLVRIIALFLPQNGWFSSKHTKKEAQAVGKGCNIDEPLKHEETRSKKGHPLKNGS